MTTVQPQLPNTRWVWQLGRALRLVWDSGHGWLLASVALLVVQGLLPSLTLYLMKLIVDAVAAGLADPAKEPAFGPVVRLIALVGAVVIVGALCRSIAALAGEALGQRVADHMHDLLHAQSMAVDLEYYENAQYYDTLYRAQQEAPFRPTRIVNGLVNVGQSGLSLLAMAGLLVSLHAGIAAVLFAVAIPGALVRFRYAGRLYRWHREHTPAERQAWYFTSMLTRDTHAKEIRLFGLGPLFMHRFRKVRRQLWRERLRIVAKRSAAELMAQTGATLVVLGAYIFIAYWAVHGLITLGDLVMYYQAVQRAQSFFWEALRGLAGLYEDGLFLANLYEFLDLKRKVAEPLHPKPVPGPMQSGIVLDRVSFQYPTSTKTVLQEITLTIRPGEHVALVGENGSGKTTLIKLLCRLYDPTEGTITLDGIDLREFTSAALRREISVIFQDYARYHLTAQENIWLGDISLPPDLVQIAAAARYAGADEVISRLTHGYDTILGKWFGEGEELSSGEWQKVALARAFLRNAQIIVLDEPTSAMDPEAEYELFKRFHQLAEGRTVILISHRLSTARIADCIYVLEDGRIIEHGTHDDLIRRSGKYAYLFDIQAQHYR